MIFVFRNSLTYDALHTHSKPNEICLMPDPYPVIVIWSFLCFIPFIVADNFLVYCDAGCFAHVRNYVSDNALSAISIAAPNLGTVPSTPFVILACRLACTIEDSSK